MIRSFLFGASLASLVPVLAEAVWHHWLAAVPLAVLLIAGIVKLAPSENMQ